MSKNLTKGDKVIVNSTASRENSFTITTKGSIGEVMEMFSDNETALIKFHSITGLKTQFKNHRLFTINKKYLTITEKRVNGISKELINSVGGLTFVSPTMGCDPELFISGKDGDIISADKFFGKPGTGKVFFDGIQAEINPSYDGCRQLLNSHIATCLAEVFNKVGDNKLEIKAVVPVKKKTIDEADDRGKEFGCEPDINAHKNCPNKIKLNGLKHLKRYAGGHIHYGFAGYINISQKAKKDPSDLIKLFDIIVGNTCVLLDRSEESTERRKYYGKAGDYRLPQYGIEYRTLSNFWLNHPSLASLVFGLGRIACIYYNDNLEQDVFDTINMDKIVKTINTNNFSLAKKNFQQLEEAIVLDPLNDFRTGCKPNKSNIPIRPDNYDQFKELVSKGIKIFGTDLEHNWKIKKKSDGTRNIPAYSQLPGFSEGLKKCL